MDTVKLIKKAQLHFLIFACACMISNFCFFLNHVMPKDVFFGIGLYGMLFWAVNPLPVIYSAKGLIHYYRHHKDEYNISNIGKKRLVLPAILFGSMVLYYLSAGIMVAFTGGA